LLYFEQMCCTCKLNLSRPH